MEADELRDLFRRRLLDDRLLVDEMCARLEAADAQRVLEPLLRQVIQVVDRIPESTPDGLVASVRHELLDLLERQGVYPYAVLGERFDPNLHRAVGAADVHDGRVVRELRTGYVQGERVLRVAEVEVGPVPSNPCT